ncbi:flagellin [Heliophilum fasciatum]|uniref:Flagellin n=1 Tax=Heliophilum fasciatum TaxID=35700 RepID=A0A4R2RDC5_9FIRM|nr:flagellin [Heliophilum fasciatum]MCW2279226.1 flagellin [Heliophilum fasciatum]TCP60813.1 flagellin [Heliophilum fasciatum]
MNISHNLSDLATLRNITSNSSQISKAFENISTGLRVNIARDDASGLAISEKMRGQIRGMTQAARNAQDGISLMQVAEGALSEIHSLTQRMRELAVQAGNDTNTNIDHSSIQKEINQLTSEVDRIANDTEYNNKKLLNAGPPAVLWQGTISTSNAGDLLFQVGPNTGQSITVQMQDMRAKALGITDNAGHGLEVSTSSNASIAIQKYDDAIEKVSSFRIQLGAYQNRLESALSNLSYGDNLIATESRIRNADIAKEMINFQKGNILTKASRAMFAQTNQDRQQVLQLISANYSA